MEADMLNLKRALRGDERAFEALISPYADATYRLALRMMGNEQDAADMAQEALLRAWRSLSSYKGQSRFSTWLYRITTNVCLDELRKRKNNQNMSIQEMEESGMETVDPAETPEQALERGQLRQELQSARCRRAAPPGRHFGRCTAVVGRRKFKLLQARRYRSRRCFGTYRFMGRFRSVFKSRRWQGRGHTGQLYRYFRRRNCLLCSA